LVEHPKDIGDRTTLAVMLALRNAGYAISVRFGENTRVFASSRRATASESGSDLQPTTGLDR
jgi:hypothetical protein